MFFNNTDTPVPFRFLICKIIDSFSYTMKISRACGMLNRNMPAPPP